MVPKWLAVLMLLVSLSESRRIKKITPSFDQVDTIRIDPKTGHYVDSHGRTRIFHGVNVVYKVDPFLPQSDTFDPHESFDADTMDFLHKWGFNLVRLGVMWPGVEPTLKQNDETYLKNVSSLASKLASRGVYTLVDLHQDVGSRRFCGEGFPEHYIDAMFDDPNSDMNKAAAFPHPMNAPMSINASGIPTMEDCKKTDFGMYYITNQVGAMWKQLYTPGTELHSGFLRYWSTMAELFKDAPHVLGYELINEPSGYCLDDPTGSCHPATQAGKAMISNQVERESLAPLYQAARDVIRAAGAGQPIFYGSTVVPKLGADLFPEVPLQDDDQQVLAYHIYCIPNILPDGIISKIGCDIEQNVVSSVFNKFLDNHKGLGSMLTEFGSVGPEEDKMNELHRLLRMSDDRFESWAYWQLKMYQDFTSFDEKQPFWDKDSNLEAPKVKTLSRTYARAIAGVPLGMTFDPATAAFELVFKATITAAPTEIYLNEEIHYPEGFVVDIEPANCLTKETPETNFLHFTLETGSTCLGKEVSIQVTSKSSPSARAGGVISRIDRWRKSMFGPKPKPS